MIEKEESSFSDLFSKLGIKGSGVPEPTSKKPCEPELKSVVLAYEKRSGNKVVTTIRDVPEPIRQKTLQELKKALGTGGSVVDNLLVIQGDRRKDLVRLLEKRGVKVRGERG
ncbi:MAG TPA: stress response translation initiation inhibitor YciH [Planctomycetota bacterium]|jgi:translation initiation factor 1 (eIF-1/SUI1)|nr:stress response translation initiation inhibitor YciH [Planctomycetota bacterium]MDP6129120.1 stress response translation initiation inhibitor YciH [Planctomycetota bacterium]MDP7245197.1 stress response translation initiation inhibitor YciH [Planctomycetota bacterium]HJM39015.1 stress response translation initiation inhibitor YciH [Planctomycetota bacterium]|tara:strand:+ start:53376 stop:53711 length:336 start_codon:yes stop_codon:yes gene_type:complete